MTDAILSYRAMAYNNGWANHRLLAACARLSQFEFIAPRTGFFPSVRATLNHVLVIDLFYVDAMEGGTLGPAAWADPEPCATMDAPLARVFSTLAHALIILMLLLPETCGRLITSLEVEAAGARRRQRSRFCHKLQRQRLPAPGNPAPIPSQK